MLNLCLYVIHSDDGCLKNYHYNVIKEIKRYYKIIVISNGFFKDIFAIKSILNKHIFKNYYETILIRDNIGYDFGAWKSFILNNKNLLYNVDNLLITNDSYCCINSMKNLLLKTINTKYDFYGATLNKEYQLHIQSYYVNFKNKILKDKYFYDFWKQLNTDNFISAVLNGEIKLTKYLSKKYTWDIYCNTIDLPTQNYTYKFPYFLINVYNFPLIKRKNIFTDKNLILKK